MLIKNIFSLIYYNLKKAVKRVVGVFLVFAEDYFRYKYKDVIKEENENEDIWANFR